MCRYIMHFFIISPFFLEQEKGLCITSVAVLIQFIVNIYSVVIFFVSMQVFLCEYAGPLFVYLLFYLRPTIIYGAVAATAPISPVVQYVKFISCLKCNFSHLCKTHYRMPPRAIGMANEEVEKSVNADQTECLNTRITQTLQLP